MKLINITTELITKGQLKKLFVWNNNKEITKFFKSKNKTIKQIKKGLTYTGTYHFIINKNNKDIGYIFFTKVNDDAYITITIDRRYWGKGYAITQL